MHALGCLSGRQWVLRSVIASIGASPTLTHAPRRAFSSTIRPWNEARERIQQDDHAQHDIAPPAEAPADADQPPPAAPSVPWYLQSQLQPTHEPQPTPFSARQALPDLPANAPPLLQPLLEHISTDLGLDALLLLDLRALDPPPALGANTLMLLATARSEKHLHVSADRLCRWLRSDPYNLTPYADGLLGRNELKLKMRRKAKRTRLMAGVGAKASAEGGDGELEDGVRTGWVCVNVGRVEGGELAAEELGRTKELESGHSGAQQSEEQTVALTEGQTLEGPGFVGFGTHRSGCGIVVQMMTEEKRAQIDLEKLWGGILRRAKKEREVVDVEGRSAAAVEGLDVAAVDGVEGGVQKEVGNTV
ncbi:hypothetical protein LTR08_002627 [Meristemomyces frigidus]|nr:hypothetical protein LTR08_002627 [Meristemomyces frigidus]